MPAFRCRAIVYAQNFLHSRSLVDALLQRSALEANDLILEIGPGRGLITERLALRCRKVVAVEKDPLLAARLIRRFTGHPRVAIYAGDALRFPLPHAPYKVFANIPFNITTALVTRLTEAPDPPEDCSLVVQREAARRIMGCPAESLYALLLKPWFEPSITYHFRHTDFVPPPQVECVLLRLRKRGPPLIDASETQRYRDLVTYLFTAWAPSVTCTLRSLLGTQQLGWLCRDVGLPHDATPSMVPFEQWLALFERLNDGKDGRIWEKIRGAEDRLKRRNSTLEKSHRTRAARPHYAADRQWG